MIITQAPNNFIISFPFNPSILKAVKSIPGSRWIGARKYWTVPIHAHEQVDDLRRKYCLAEKYLVPEIVKEVPPLPELTIDIPLKRSMYDYQRLGVAAGMQFKRFINGDDMGLGKSMQTIATIKGARLSPTLIICPATLKDNWMQEFKASTDLKVDIMTDSIKATWPQFIRMGMVDVFITNYESLKKFFVVKITRRKDKEGELLPLTIKDISFRPEIAMFKAIVIDEFHKCKAPDTIQSKLVKGICANKEWVMGLTGTPIMNKTKDLVSQLSIINRLQEFGGYQYFMKRYCGGNGKENTNLRELNFRLGSTCFFRRMKKEVLLDLPDKTRSVYLCDITTRKEYNSALADFSAYLKEYTEKTDEQIKKSLKAEVLVRMGKLMNISARGKMNEVADYIDEIMEAGEKVGVFIHQKEIAMHILKNYPGAVSIRGDDSPEQRQAATAAFQGCKKCGVKLEYHTGKDHDHVPSDTLLIVCSIKAAGVGITLTAGSRVAMVELPWHAAATDQCEDRFFRNGQKNAVQATYFLGKGTIDEDIYEIIESKRAVAGEVTGTPDDIQRILIDKMAAKLLGKENL